MDWKKLLESITAPVNEELRLRHAYLVAENCILLQQVRGRVQLTNSDRQALAEIGMKLGKKALEEIATVVKPATSLAWHRRLVEQKGDCSQLRKAVGRLRTPKEIEDLVVRMARENRSWGYDRIVGALANLSYTISDQTVGNILKRHGIAPAPERKKTVTWREFIRIHMDVLMATEFFTSEGGMWGQLLMSSLLFFISLRFLLPLLDKRVLYHMLSPCALPDCREDLFQGVDKVVFLPVVARHPIRDGPLQNRPWLGGLLQDDDRAAA
jgi:putative transposase